MNMITMDIRIKPLDDNKEGMCDNKSGKGDKKDNHDADIDDNR